MRETLDGDYQTFKANDGAYIREHFFGRDPRTAELVKDWTDDEIWALQRGGNDYRKMYAAYKAATEHKGQPTVILAHTVKGYLLGGHFAGRNATHQMKKLTLDDLKALRDRLHIPITDEQLEANPKMPPYYRPAADDPSLLYMLDRRRQLGGFIPERRDAGVELELPGDKTYDILKGGSGKQEVASTMAFVRLLKELIKDKGIGRRIVPIVPDESRTFGLESLFPTKKIFNTQGQNYTPVDADMMLSYRESASGQLMHTGINEAGSTSLFQVAGTSYATHGEPMIPVYIFYSMFGFQRTGDQFWAAGDQLTRGFIIGATAGRTTLTGEGTQHMDGHSPVIAATNDAVVSYDPAYAYEIRHIVRDALGEDIDAIREDLAHPFRSVGSAAKEMSDDAAQAVNDVVKKDRATSLSKQIEAKRDERLAEKDAEKAESSGSTEGSENSESTEGVENAESPQSAEQAAAAPPRGVLQQADDVEDDAEAETEAGSVEPGEVVQAAAGAAPTRATT